MKVRERTTTLEPITCRTAWISDLHLGTRGSNAEELYRFLEHYRFAKLYVVGDLIDTWRLKRFRYWPQAHTDVVQELLNRTHQGVDLIFIPGNHDEFILQFAGHYGKITIAKEDIHVTAAGKRLLVIHGHEFDIVAKHYVWVTHLGEMGYNFLQWVSRWLNRLRMFFGFSYWSLSAYVKRRVKDGMRYVSNYEHALTDYAGMHHADGVVCGHIHLPVIKSLGALTYYNCGDWVEHCTALVEHLDGRMELLHYGPPGALPEPRTVEPLTSIASEA